MSEWVGRVMLPALISATGPLRHTERSDLRASIHDRRGAANCPERRLRACSSDGLVHTRRCAPRPAGKYGRRGPRRLIRPRVCCAATGSRAAICGRTTRPDRLTARRAGLGAAGIGGNLVAMSFAPVPATAAWHHRGARSGFEVAYFGARGDRCQIQGWTTAVEDGLTWAVEYVIEVDAAWATRSARIRGRSAAGFCSALLEADGAGHWLAGGRPARGLDGCLDVDLEASALTNALPVRRMGLPVSGRAAEIGRASCR